MTDHVLSTHGLTRRFGGLTAVDCVDLAVGAGERRAILGPNGAGKSSLFNLLAGTDSPTEGRVVLFGTDVTALDARRRSRLGLARTFQTSRLLSGLSVADNLYLAAVGVAGGRFRLRRTKADDEARDRASAAANQVGLRHRVTVLAGDLSHSEQRQLEIALALVARPRLLLLDEPAAGLSRSERQMLTDLLLGLDRTVTLLIIEHDMDVALTVADRVTMMNEGAVVVEGSPEEIRVDPLVHEIYLGRAHA